MNKGTLARMSRLESRCMADGEIDLSKLSDADLLDRIYRLDPGMAERWPKWPEMTTDERLDAFLSEIPDAERAQATSAP